MKVKTKTQYSCQQCAASFSQWAGQCTQCGAWNTLQEGAVVKPAHRSASYANEKSLVTLASQVKMTDTPRLDCGQMELNRVLGGGVVEGSVVLIGGDPGIGKSTLLLQTLSHLSATYPVLYVTGEESLQQVALSARRLSLPLDSLQLLAETQIESILYHIQTVKPKVIVVDSIQTLYTETLTASSGTVSQVRECASLLVRFAKTHQVAVFIVGHVTKDGVLAGPRVLEHMVDCVLYFEGERDGRFRLIRAVKNRFGAVNELGVFAMTEKGLKGVNNPSAMFLSRNLPASPGSVTMVTWEGTRPILVEIQALVDQAYGQPKRLAIGLDAGRLSVLLAVLHRHAGISFYDQDVFVNVVGGVKVSETASDLALILAVLSSLRNRIVSQKLIVFGEIGLAGEIRPVQQGQERLKEAQKHGFTEAIVPKANCGKTMSGLAVKGVQFLQEALEMI